MDTAATGSTFDISNLDRLGKSEVRSSGIRVRGGISLWGLRYNSEVQEFNRVLNKNQVEWGGNWK